MARRSLRLFLIIAVLANVVVALPVQALAALTMASAGHNEVVVHDSDHDPAHFDASKLCAAAHRPLPSGEGQPSDGGDCQCAMGACAAVLLQHGPGFGLLVSGQAAVIRPEDRADLHESHPLLRPPRA